ncbi:kinase-like protein [Basidiobolus meristosporus CBS 931.73]|uniref:non-specific serine/threonine protein kinase n=1 Tax=Basidiobolus meristosporus CBS 931.73 TaxID=1314790 RepID=A0A1Y1XV09_9FUNG|nr:kinase-like protein [Basidiobolus meristosporus CBS 931.73]|eukprot:ORX89588.1 kinase-like protein [Basidiobolus meristosporus CBS 931.73]
METYIPRPHDDDDDDDDSPKVVDRDPTGRFERYEESLGIGGYKEVYKGFDQEEGVEVAWNQLRIDHLGKKDAQKIVYEVEILKTLRHENIINLFHTWTAKGPDNRNRVYFITELMTSGTLKQYIRRTKCQLKPRVLKSWCRQILRGLNYLHTKDPPIIHRDLKCDNIFINGNNGQAKIGDLGLATFMRKQHVSSVLGTPEFMAPELYDEHYDERADIYAFGMCVLEMLTREYPYSECQNPAQIYRKVTQGIRPASLQRITDPDILQFIELCIQYDPNRRPSAAQLLCHPFLALDSGTGPESVYSSSFGSSVSLPAESIPQSTTSSQRSTDTWISDKESATYPALAHLRLSNGSNYLGESKEPLVPAYPTEEPPHPPNFASPSRPTASENQDAFRVTQTSPKPSSVNHCDVEIIQNSGDGEVILRMTCAVPGSDPQTVKFPLNLKEDTPESVVSEMVREELLSEEYKILAEKNIGKAIRLACQKKTANTELNMLEHPAVVRPVGTLHSSMQEYFQNHRRDGSSLSFSSYTSSESSYLDHNPDMSERVDVVERIGRPNSMGSRRAGIQPIFDPADPFVSTADYEPLRRAKSAGPRTTSRESPQKLPPSIFGLYDSIDARSTVRPKSNRELHLAAPRAVLPSDSEHSQHRGSRHRRSLSNPPRVIPPNVSTQPTQQQRTEAGASSMPSGEMYYNQYETSNDGDEAFQQRHYLRAGTSLPPYPIGRT